MTSASGFWWAYASLYDIAWDTPLTAAVSRAVARAVPEGGVIVDLGSGTGLTIREARRTSRHVIGIDRSQKMIRRARARGRITDHRLADANGTGLPAEQADAVVCANVLHLHSDPESVIAEARRIVRPGGTIVFVTPTADATPGNVFRADLRAGTSYPRALAAATARIVVGVLAGFARVAPAQPEGVASLIREASRGDDGVNRERVHGVQDITWWLAEVHRKEFA